MDNYIDKSIIQEKYFKYYQNNPDFFFLSPGRLEIIGNHTDHNNGLALVSSASLYIKAGVKKRDDGVIRLYSEGHDLYEVKAIYSEPNEKEFVSTDALIKGIVSGFLKQGFTVGGFDCYCFSEVIEGSGISSSAAFEMLICVILNSLYNEDKADPITLVKIAQASEKFYFGKPCGLLDQTGSAFAGISMVDFCDPNNPQVQNTSFPFDLKIVLTNPGGSHAGLTDYYASIPNDMHHAAEIVGKKVLREISPEEFANYALKYPTKFTKQELNRAKHFYEECLRVRNAYKAIKENDEKSFINAINGSGLSSSNILCNTQVPGRFDNSPERALQIAREVAPHSAHRVHGGGFMGTIISYCKPEEYDKLVAKMKETFGVKSVIDVSISQYGASKI